MPFFLRRQPDVNEYAGAQRHPGQHGRFRSGMVPTTLVAFPSGSLHQQDFHNIDARAFAAVDDGMYAAAVCGWEHGVVQSASMAPVSSVQMGTAMAFAAG
ncbi:MAG TPA: hypothetical protein VHI13_14120 [Candidatus Kapabacteria bacterium]|nr:hypothetical protein [Candidatus Kapabacteria bacterium]